MTYDLSDRRRATTARRKEQVRHLLRSVGVQVEGEEVPYFVEPTPGKFRRNPAVKNVEVTDEQLRTLDVPAEVPAKIPATGLPTAALRHLIDMGLRGGDDL